MAEVRHPENYDCIVIGSGMGGLSTASLLAQVKGWKVLVLERHFKLGGYTHTFKRRQFKWDIGVHYVGAMSSKSFYRWVFDLVTQKGLNWNKMPEPFDSYVFPEFTFKQYSGKNRFIADVKQRFPDETEAIDRYFKDVKTVKKWSVLVRLWRSLRLPFLSLIARIFKKSEQIAFSTLDDYFRRLNASPELQCVLGGQWGNYFLPPKSAPFLIHAVMADHYIEGGYYPVGGSSVIADSIKSIIESHGGRMIINQEVQEIIVRGGRSVGVKTKKTHSQNGKFHEFYAPCIVSDAGAKNTYLKLLPKSVSLPFREEVKNYPCGINNVSLYLGLNDSPEKIGLHGGNYWLFDSMDYNKLMDQNEDLLSGKPGLALLSFPSLKDPENQGPHTGIIIAPISYDVFERWANEKWKKRSPDYEEVKETISQALIDFINSKYPGFKNLVAYHELSTPLTNEYFTGHERGMIYGLPPLPDRYRLDWLGVRTPIPNLYLTGADALCHGVVGALMSGYITASAILGRTGVFKLGRAVIKYQRKIKREKAKIK